MDNIKPWQIILFIVALLVLGFSVWMFVLKTDVPRTSRYMSIDVLSGQLYDIQKGKAKGIAFPVKNPETGDRTIYPAVQGDGNLWEIPVGYEQYITNEVRERSKLEGNSLRLPALPADPIVQVMLK